MIESELKYTKENVSEFVKYTIFRKNKSSGIYMICYLAAMVIFAVAGVVLAAVTQMWMFLLAVVVCLLLIAAAMLAVAFALKKYTNAPSRINSKHRNDPIEITARCILLKHSGAATDLGYWTAVASVDFYKSSAYIVTHDGYLFIIDENTVREGSLDELRQIAEEKLVKTDD